MQKKNEEAMPKMNDSEKAAMREPFEDEKLQFIGLKSNVEKAIGGKILEKFEIIGLTCQFTDAGKIFWVKVRHADDKYLHMKVLRPINS